MGIHIGNIWEGHGDFNTWVDRLPDGKKLKKKTSKQNRHNSKTYKRHKKSNCARCGYAPVDLSELTVHHKDHDRKNNDPSNLETLCKCCHKKHHLEKGPGKTYDR